MTEPTDEQIREWIEASEKDYGHVHLIDKLYYGAVGACLGAILAFSVVAVSR